MSDQLPDNASDLENALRSLVPLGAGLDRDRLMYRAGRAAGRNGRAWLWPASSGMLGAAVVVLAVLLARQPPVETVVRTVVVKVPVPAPAPPVHPPPSVSPEPDAPKAMQAADDAQDLAYYRLQKQVERFGVDAIPPLPSPGPPANELPLTMDRLLGVPPVTRAKSTSLGSWFSQN